MRWLSLKLFLWRCQKCLRRHNAVKKRFIHADRILSVLCVSLVQCSGNANELHPKQLGVNLCEHGHDKHFLTQHKHDDKSVLCCLPACNTPGLATYSPACYSTLVLREKLRPSKDLYNILPRLGVCCKKIDTLINESFSILRKSVCFLVCNLENIIALGRTSVRDLY